MVVGSEAEAYRRRRTLRAALGMISEALTEEKRRLAPGWVTSRTSRRSLGTVKSWDCEDGSSLVRMAGDMVGNGEGTGVVSG